MNSKKLCTDTIIALASVIIFGFFIALCIKIDIILTKGDNVVRIEKTTTHTHINNDILAPQCTGKTVNSVIAEASKSARPYDDILLGETNSPCIEMFGIRHYRYKDCDKEDLVTVDGMKVRKDCAKAFKEMKAAAKKDGVNISIVSGYRSSAYQIQVFKKKFKDSDGKAIYPTDAQMKSRLKYSAPSGYSEHHTGLAIDINSTETNFKNTKAYRWLCEHAQDYGFEISFPQDNAQGLGFEPWHWRYVGEYGENKYIFNQARRNDPRFEEEYIRQ